MIQRVFSYVRVSGASQVEGDGFPRQEAACKAFAESKGWAVSRSFREQQTGGDSFCERPMLQEALSLCGTEYSIIIVERVDRIGRDLIVAELFFRECKKLGVQVYAADSGEELVNAEGDPTRNLIRQILGALAEWDRAQISKKLQAGRRRKKMETGKPCGGPQPYGNHCDPEIKAREEWAILQIVGAKKRGSTFRQITDWLNGRGVPTANGGDEWSCGSVYSVWKKNQYLLVPKNYESKNPTALA